MTCHHGRDVSRLASLSSAYPIVGRNARRAQTAAAARREHDDANVGVRPASIGATVAVVTFRQSADDAVRIRELESLRNALGRLLKKMPLELRRDPDFRLLESVAEIQRHITIVHLINRRREFSSSAKDYEFSRATVRQLWEAGLEDMRGACAHPGWSAATEVVRGVRIFDPESSQPR